MTKDCKRITYQKEIMWKEINEQCAKYDSECKYLGSHKASKQEIDDMCQTVKDRKCSYT